MNLEQRRAVGPVAVDEALKTYKQSYHKAVGEGKSHFEAIGEAVESAREVLGDQEAELRKHIVLPTSREPGQKTWHCF